MISFFKAIDKQAHAWAGMAIFFASSLALGSAIPGFIIALSAGVLREAMGNEDCADFAATAIGAGAGALVWWATT